MSANSPPSLPPFSPKPAINFSSLDAAAEQIYASSPTDSSQEDWQRASVATECAEPDTIATGRTSGEEAEAASRASTKDPVKQGGQMKRALMQLSKQSRSAVLNPPRRASLSVLEATKSMPPRESTRTWASVPGRDAYAGINDLLQSFAQKIQGSPEAARSASTPVPYNDTDQKIWLMLERGQDKPHLQTFYNAWQHLKRSPKEIEPRKILAHLYAQLMDASHLTESDQQKFHDCIDLGRRALELDPSCCLAYEKLGIAYSIVQAPLSEAKRCIDEVVRLGHMAQLAVAPGEPCAIDGQGSYQPSADFYFAYWRLFRGDPARKHQADWALERYNEADPAQRSFDAKLRDLKLLELQAAYYA